MINVFFFLDCKTVRIFAIVVRTCDSNELSGASIQNGEWACEARANSHRTMHVFGIKPTVLQSMFVQGRGQRNSLSPRSDVPQESSMFHAGSGCPGLQGTTIS